VLLIGVGGLGAEVAKNIVLAGVRSLMLLDDQNVCDCLYFAFCCFLFGSLELKHLSSVFSIVYYRFEDK